MSALQPFNPAYGSTRSLVGTATEVVLNYPDGVSGNFPPQLLLSNVGTAVCFVRITRATDLTASGVTDLPVLPNTQVVVTISYYEAFDVQLAAGATGSTLYVTQGSGF